MRKPLWWLIISAIGNVSVNRTLFPLADGTEKSTVIYIGNTICFADYRHRESKHLNSTAIPTLDVLPEAEKKIQTKCLELPTSIPNRTLVISSVNGDSNAVTLNSNVVTVNTQTYSNCVTLSTVPLLKIANLSDLHESDHSIENSFHSDGDIIEEEMEIEDMMLEDCLQSTDQLGCVTKTEYSIDDIEDIDDTDDTDDTSTENTSFVGEIGLNCADAKTKLSDRLPNYVEVIETSDETDDEQPSDPNALLYENFSRKDLIDELVAARNRIDELETKLENIQKAHLTMVQNLNNFNKVLIS